MKHAELSLDSWRVRRNVYLYDGDVEGGTRVQCALCERLFVLPREVGAADMECPGCQAVLTYPPGAEW